MVSILLPTVSVLLYALTLLFVFHFFPFSFFACLFSCFVYLYIFSNFFSRFEIVNDWPTRCQTALTYKITTHFSLKPILSVLVSIHRVIVIFLNFFPFLSVSSSFFLLLPRPSRMIDQIFPFFNAFFSGKGTKWLSCKMKGLIIKYLQKTPKMQVFRGTKTYCTVKSHGDLHTAMTQWRGQIRLQNGGG